MSDGHLACQVELYAEYPDNLLLIDLCGQHDKHLTFLEEKLSISIVHRGNSLVLIGESAAAEQAKGALDAVYTRLEAGRSVDETDLDRELRMTPPASAPAVTRLADRYDIKTRKKTVEPRTQAQKDYVASLFDNELAFGIGPAGTGKTYLAVAVGVSMFISGQVDKIILSRPAVEAGEKLGYLPGDMKDKVDPYMQPLYDALNDFLPGKQLARMIEEKRIEIAPLAFMRGRTLSHAFIVLDEAQNATTMQMKMFLTRLGRGSRMVITGDRSQVDLPRGVMSGLRDAERLLTGIPKISFNYFTSKDVVRHPLVAAIIDAYDKDTQGQG